MEALMVIIKYALILIAVISIVRPLFSERRNYKFIWQVWKRFRIKMFFESLGVILLVILALIMLLEVPGLKYGWANLFFDGGGSIFTTPVIEQSHSSYTSVRILSLIFFIVLFLALPFLAKIEEDLFRRGYNSWGSVIKQSIKFGLIHCLVGIPLAAGIAIIISGFFYGYKYKKALNRNLESFCYGKAENEAVMTSITYHTMYNMIVVIPLILSSLLNL